MATNRELIKTNIISLVNDMKTREDQDQAIEDYAEGLSQIIQDAIQSATIQGLQTTVTGTVTPAGAVTGVGNQIGGTGTLL